MPDYSALKAEFALPEYAGMTDAQALAHVQAKYPPPQVPKPFTLADITACITANGQPDATAIGKLRNSPTTQAVLDAIQANDRATLATLVQMAEVAGDVSAAQASAILALLTATAADTSGKVPLPGWDWYLTDSDVATARAS